MASTILYEEIYSRFFTKVQAYDFLDLSEIQTNEFLCNWVHSTVSKPYTRRFFSSISLDDDVQSILYDMKYIIDEETDKEFVIEMLVYGMMICWIEPKIYSMTVIAQTYSSKELKYYSESKHLAQLQLLLKDCKKEQKQLQTDRTAIWNTYLDQQES